MTTTTRIETPEQLFLATYCLITDDAQRAAFLSRIQAPSPVDSRIAYAADVARDQLGTGDGLHRYDRNARAWEIIDFAFNW